MTPEDVLEMSTEHAVFGEHDERSSSTPSSDALPSLNLAADSMAHVGSPPPLVDSPLASPYPDAPQSPPLASDDAPRPSAEVEVPTPKRAQSSSILEEILGTMSVSSPKNASSPVGVFDDRSAPTSPFEPGAHVPDQPLGWTASKGRRRRSEPMSRVPALTSKYSAYRLASDEVMRAYQIERVGSDSSMSAPSSPSTVEPSQTLVESASGRDLFMLQNQLLFERELRHQYAQLVRSLHRQKQARMLQDADHESLVRFVIICSVC